MTLQQIHWTGILALACLAAAVSAQQPSPYYPSAAAYPAAYAPQPAPAPAYAVEEEAEEG